MLSKRLTYVQCVLQAGKDDECGTPSSRLQRKDSLDWDLAHSKSPTPVPEPSNGELKAAAEEVEHCG